MVSVIAEQLIKETWIPEGAYTLRGRRATFPPFEQERVGIAE